MANKGRYVTSENLRFVVYSFNSRGKRSIDLKTDISRTYVRSGKMTNK